MEADLGGAAITALSGELLPDWYDDWVLLEAENWRQLRLHALEVLAGLLTAAGRYGDAAAAALAAVRADPLRESAHAALKVVLEGTRTPVAGLPGPDGDLGLRPGAGRSARPAGLSTPSGAS